MYLIVPIWMSSSIRTERFHHLYPSIRFSYRRLSHASRTNVFWLHPLSKLIKFLINGGNRSINGTPCQYYKLTKAPLKITPDRNLYSVHRVDSGIELETSCRLDKNNRHCQVLSQEERGY
ncbi:hypothetical protein CDAR_711 [Caerostris darwini]|uniref:Uncharacterized protein n=1 Tax=Caerostris darwini TaxID=1538125 RepID=A0AAV4UCH1_9ARAC|nr:hypothetical protein CDAR_711 [Caerostris darwini]